MTNSRQGLSASSGRELVALLLGGDGKGVLKTKKGGPLAERTARAYTLDARQLVALMCEGRKVDQRREAAYFARRAEWARAREGGNGGAVPVDHDSVIYRFFTLKPDDVWKLIEKMQKRCRASTVRRRILGMSAIWHHMTSLKMVDGDPFVGIIPQLPAVGKSVQVVSAKTWRFFRDTSPDEVLRLVGRDFGGTSRSKERQLLTLRDLVLALLCLFEGLKSGDLIGIRGRDFLPKGDGQVSTLTIHRGTRSIAVQLSPQTEAALLAYISARYSGQLQSVLVALRRSEQALFPNKTGCREIANRSVRRKLRDLFRRLKLEEASPAELRHTAVVHALSEGMEPRQVRERFRFRQGFDLGHYLLHVERWRAELAQLEPENPVQKTAPVSVPKRAPVRPAPPPFCGVGGRPPAPRAASPYGRARPLPIDLPTESA